MLYRSLLCFLLGVSFSLAQDAPRVPNINDLLTIKSAGGPRISPDGKWVAYSVTEADFRQDAFVSQIWLANTRLAFGSRQHYSSDLQITQITNKEDCYGCFS